eukprot:6671910-Prorocentrum_lima.AAC.1
MHRCSQPSEHVGEEPPTPRRWGTKRMQQTLGKKGQEGGRSVQALCVWIATVEPGKNSKSRSLTSRQ